MTDAQTDIYRIGPWRFYPARNVLSKDGEARRLENRTSRALLLLCRNGGEPVSRTDLIDEIWEGRSVSANSVAIVISDLRKALDDTAKSPRYIETVAKRGYRLKDVSRASPPAAGHRQSPFRIGSMAMAGLAALVLVLFFTLTGAEDDPLVFAMTDIRNRTAEERLDPSAIALSELAATYLSQYPDTALVRHRWNFDAPDPSRGLYDHFGAGVRVLHVGGNLVRDGEDPVLTLYANVPMVDEVVWSQAFPLADTGFTATVQQALAAMMASLGRDEPNDGSYQLAGLGSAQAEQTFWQAAYYANLTRNTGHGAAGDILARSDNGLPDEARQLLLAKVRVDTPLPEAETLSRALRADLLLLEAQSALWRDGDAGAAGVLAGRAFALRPGDAQARGMAALLGALVDGGSGAVRLAEQAVAQEPLLNRHKAALALARAIAGEEEAAGSILSGLGPENAREAALAAFAYQILGHDDLALKSWRDWLALQDGGSPAAQAMDPPASYEDLLAAAGRVTRADAIMLWQVLAGAAVPADAPQTGLMGVACSPALAARLGLSC